MSSGTYEPALKLKCKGWVCCAEHDSTWYPTIAVEHYGYLPQREYGRVAQ